MASRLDIIDSALAELAQEPIEDDPLDARFAESEEAEEELTTLLEDETAQAVYRIYPQVKESLLTAHPWTWLQETSALTAANPHDRDTAGPAGMAWPFRYRWNHPNPGAGGLRALYQGPLGMEHSPRTHGWRPQGDFIYTDFTPVVAVYQADKPETAWPQLFVNAVVLALAARLALPITYDENTMRSFRQLAADALADAARVDSQSHLPESITSFGFTDAHFIGFGGNFHRV